MKKDKRYNFWFLLGGIIDIVYSAILMYFFFFFIFIFQLLLGGSKKDIFIGDINGGKLILGLFSLAFFLIFVFGIMSIVWAGKRKVSSRLPIAIISILIELACFGGLFFMLVTENATDFNVLVFIGISCLAPILKIIGLCLNRTEIMIIPNQYSTASRVNASIDANQLNHNQNINNPDAK